MMSSYHNRNSRCKVKALLHKGNPHAREDGLVIEIESKTPASNSISEMQFSENLRARFCSLR